MGDTAKKLHLRMSSSMMETLKPTGCRMSPDWEAAWRLGAAIVVARETEARGFLPIMKAETETEEPSGSGSAEIHIPLSEEEMDFLTEVSSKEGGSRGRLAREFLLTAQKVVEEFPCVPTQKGLVSLIRKRFADFSAL